MKDHAPRRGRPVNDPLTTRMGILVAAARIFNGEGYFGTDTNKIAREAGYAPATLYRHFRDKKDVFLQAYDHWVDADWSAIERGIPARGTPLEIARAVAKAHGAHHGRWVQFRRSMHGLAAVDEEVRAFHLGVRQRQLARLRRLLARLGAPSRSSGDLLYSFLAIERASNAIADGDLAALRVSTKVVVGRIESEIVYLLTGKRIDFTEALETGGLRRAERR